MDTSKSVFQLHGVDEAEQVVLRRKLRRRDVLKFFEKLALTRIGMAACGGSHYWARELQQLGHAVVLVPPQYVKPDVARGKNDAADAEAICEAMSGPREQQRLVPVKTADQGAAQMLVGAREALIRHRTQLTNTMRGYASEFGLIAAKGLGKIEPLLARIAADDSLPPLAKDLFATLGQRHSAEPSGTLNSGRRNHLGQRSLATAPTGRTYDRKPPDQPRRKLLQAGGSRFRRSDAQIIAAAASATSP